MKWKTIFVISIFFVLYLLDNIYNTDQCKIDQLTFRDYAYCMKCKRPWTAIDPHWVDYTCCGFTCGGVAALCKWCWLESSKEERLYYYRSRWVALDKTFPDSLHWIQVRSIIMNGNIYDHKKTEKQTK